LRHGCRLAFAGQCFAFLLQLKAVTRQLRPLALQFDFVSAFLSLKPTGFGTGRARCIRVAYPAGLRVHAAMDLSHRASRNQHSDQQQVPHFSSPVLNQIIGAASQQSSCWSRSPWHGPAYSDQRAGLRITLFSLVLRLRRRSGLPLHVARCISAPTLQGSDMVDHVTGAGPAGFASRGAGVLLLEIVLGVAAANDFAVRVPPGDR
jgi:hypothetical protein